MKLHESISMLALAPPAWRRGFSLIELMVAMTLGLFLLAGLTAIFMNASQSFRAQSALGLMQGNARYAFEIMGVDIRMTGFTGTRTGDTLDDVVGTLSPTSLSSLKNLGTPLIGYENTNPPNVDVCTAGSPAGCYLANTDSLTVVRVNTENKYAITGHNTPSSNFTLSSGQSNLPEAGEIFVAADYIHAALFKVQGVSGDIVSYSGTFVYPFSGNTNTLYLYRLSGVSYYIGRNPVGEPALYRDKLGHNSGATASIAEELVQGVENMQITYGVDTGTDNNVDDYRTADLVTDWSRVLSVRITLTLVSGQQEMVGTTGDRLLRKSFTNTIAIRNRLL